MITDEQIAAGNDAYGSVSAFHDKSGHLRAIYTAMKALDPEIANMREALENLVRLLTTEPERPWSDEDWNEVMDNAIGKARAALGEHK
jgi:hypothetical protein